MNIYNDFLGNDLSNVTLPFIGGDSEEQFINNSKKMPEDWHYHTTPVTYDYNNYGHRCKNFEDIDQDNYILVTGCSHTMGVGLELEKTYPYLLSEKLGMDYYNLSVPATGIDVLEYNLLTWYFKIPKKPKLLVVQWPDHSRFIEYNPLYDHVLERGTWNTEPNYESFIVNSEETGMFYARKAMSTSLIKTVTKNTPSVNCNYVKQQQYGFDNLYFSIVDKARDLGHAGIKSHAKFTDLIMHYIEVKGWLK
jgi:hypothetical protein